MALRLLVLSEIQNQHKSGVLMATQWMWDEALGLCEMEVATKIPA